MTSPTPHGRRFAVLVASLAGTAAVLTPGALPASGAAKPAPTNATITWDAATIEVKVTSPEATCKPDRRTFIVYNTGSEASAAQGKTNNNGVFTFPDAGTPWADGKLFAYVGKTSGCRPGQSNVLPVQAEPARAGTKARTFAELTYDDTGIKVKVTSPQASCTKGRKVEIFAYQSNQPYVQTLTGKTNDNGVYKYSFVSSTGGGDYKLTAFTRNTSACAVGQSKTLTHSPS